MSAGRRPRFQEPETAAVWAAVEVLPETALREVHRLVAQRLAIAEECTSAQGQRVARAVGALVEAHTLQLAAGATGPLSVERYRALRVKHPDHGWPPDGSVRRWLGGSWNDALRRARLGVVQGADVSLSPAGSFFTREEAIDALRSCATTLDRIPTFSEYVHWARREDIIALPGRRPQSQPVFDRLFGGWAAALAAATLVPGAPAPSGAAVGSRAAGGSTSASSTTGPGGPRSPAVGSPLPVRPSAYRYTPEQVKEALREAAAHYGRSPRSQEYGRWRQYQIAADPTRPLPSDAVIRRLAETWDEALVAAGLAALGGRATQSNPCIKRREPKPRHTDEALAEVLHEASAAVGEPFSSSAYKRWRVVQRERDRTEGRHRILPSYDVYYLRFGSWEQAKQALFELRRDEPANARSEP